MQNHTFFDHIKRFFSLNKVAVIFVVVAFCVGVLTGVFCVAKSPVETKITMLQSLPERIYFLFHGSIFLVFFVKLLLVGLLFFIFFFLSHFKFGWACNILIFLWLCNELGADICVLVVCFVGLKGILNAIILLIFKGIVLLLLLLFALKMQKICNQQKIFGGCYLANKQAEIILFLLLVFTAIVVTNCIFLFVTNHLFVF